MTNESELDSASLFASLTGPQRPRGIRRLAPFFPRHLTTIGKQPPPLVMCDDPRAFASPAVIFDCYPVPSYHAFETDETNSSTEGAGGFGWHGSGAHLTPG